MLYPLVFGLFVIAIGAIVAMTGFGRMARVTFFGSANSSKGYSFDPARDIPSLTGRVILITGAAGDLGRNTAIQLARYGRPARIYIADLPSDDSTKEALTQKIAHEAFDDAQSDAKGIGPPTEFRYLDLDLSSLKSVRGCAADLIARESRLDILYLNAGILRMEPGMTTEGYERHFGINYLGHALIAKLLMPTMLRTAQQQPDVRVIVVSSEGHLMAPKNGIDFSTLQTDCARILYAKRYGQSKVALLCFTRELAHEYPPIKVVAVHPGRIATGMALTLAKESLLVRCIGQLAPWICVPVEIGIKNHLWAATSPEVTSGMYYEPVGVPGKRSKAAKDEALSRRLRDWTNNALSGFVS